LLDHQIFEDGRIGTLFRNPSSCSLLPGDSAAITLDRAQDGGAQPGDLVEHHPHLGHRRLRLLDPLVQRVAERERPERPRPERIGEGCQSWQKRRRLVGERCEIVGLSMPNEHSSKGPK
jgi:hypothetical protein